MEFQGVAVNPRHGLACLIPRKPIAMMDKTLIMSELKADTALIHWISVRYTDL
jgi:hypothetical protein